MNAVPEVNHVEIEQQANRQPAQSQVRKQLRPMEGDHLFHGFQFDDHCAFNHEIESVPGIKMNVSVGYRQSHLRLESQPEPRQLVLQAGLIRAFEQAWTEFGVNVHRGSYDPFGQIGVNQHDLASVSAASSAVAPSAQFRGQR